MRKALFLTTMLFLLGVFASAHAVQITKKAEREKTREITLRSPMAPNQPGRTKTIKYMDVQLLMKSDSGDCFQSIAQAINRQDQHANCTWEQLARMNRSIPQDSAAHIPAGTVLRFVYQYNLH